MQAKNYAAQICRSIEKGELIKAILEKCLIDDKVSAQSILHTLGSGLESSINFNLPNGGILLGNDRKGDALSVLSLPFDKITINFKSSNGIDICVFVYEASDNWFGVVGFFKIKQTWAINPTMCFIHKENWKHPTEPCLYKAPFKNIFKINQEFSEKYESIFETSSLLCVESLLELLEALSCRNVEQTTIQKCDASLNARRVNKGKLPLYEERILTIKVNAKQGIGTRTGAHESPRQHLRRGHIRRLESGNIWVNACVVGSSEKGVIKKSYNMAA